MQLDGVNDMKSFGLYREEAQVWNKERKKIDGETTNLGYVRISEKL